MKHRFACCILLVGCAREVGPVDAGDGAATPRDSASAPVVLPPTTLFAGDGRTCAVRPNGEAWCWGAIPYVTPARGVRPTPAPVRIAGLPPVVGVSGVAGHSCAWTAQGRVWCWGENTFGQLGNGTRTDSDVPVEVVGLDQVVLVQAAYDLTCGLERTGRLFCWGNTHDLGVHGQEWNGSLTPLEVLAAHDVVSMSITDGVSCVVERTGSMLCWGGSALNPRFQFLGAPTEIARNARECAVGDASVCFSRDDGTVRCWASGSFLPDPAHAYVDGFTEIVGVTGVTQLTGGPANVYARTATGPFMCWGYDNFAQCGLATTPAITVSTPLEVTAVPDAREYAIGRNHVCAVRQAGGIVCWGDNWDGELGDGTTTSRLTPASVIGFE